MKLPPLPTPRTTVFLSLLSVFSLEASFVELEQQLATHATGHPAVADIDGNGTGDVLVHVHVDNHHIKDPSRQPGLYWVSWPDKALGTLFKGPVTGDRVDAGDINSDGMIDVVSGILTPTGDELVCWYQNPGPEAIGQNKLWNETIIGTHPDVHIKDILCADIDGNGQLDIVTRGHEHSAVFLQTDNGWVKRVLDHPRKEGLALEDLDQDGDVDLVMNGFWLETPDNPLKKSFIQHTIHEKWFTQHTPSWQDNCCSVSTGDLNGDGLPDVVLSHSENAGYPLAWYSVKSIDQVKTGPWIEHEIVTEFRWCETVDVGDIDGDGDADILAAKFARHDYSNYPTNTPPHPVSLFYNNDNGTHWERQDLSQEGIYAGKFGDLGGDGDLDIVGPYSYFSGPIWAWVNPGSKN